MSSWRFGGVQHSLSLSCYFILCLPLCGACLCSEVFPSEVVLVASCPGSHLQVDQVGVNLAAGKQKLRMCDTERRICCSSRGLIVWALAGWKWKERLVGNQSRRELHQRGRRDVMLASEQWDLTDLLLLFLSVSSFALPQNYQEIDRAYSANLKVYG